MTRIPLQLDATPSDIPPGAEIRRPDPARPFVAMSNRKRWGACALSAVLPQLRTPSGPAAEEGTAAHTVAEWYLGAKFGSPPSVAPPVPAPPQGLDGFDYSPHGVEDWQRSVLGYAQSYADNVAGLFRDCTPGTTVARVEHKIENVTIHGVRVYTVADVIAWNPAAGRLVVGDYKFGRSPVGVGDHAEPNAQCAGAAVLVARQEHLDVQQLGLAVYQPRIRAGEPWQVLAPMDAAWLAEQGHRLDAELAAVRRAADELTAGRLIDPGPGEHCSYCPSARWCPAAANYGTVALDVDANRRAVVDLSPVEVLALWAQRAAFKAFEDDLRERVKMLHESGAPGVDVKRRAGNRIWASAPAAVEALMLADRFDLLQPPGIEKAATALPEADMDALLTRAPDVLTYVATDGKQPDLARAAFAKYLTEGK